MRKAVTIESLRLHNVLIGENCNGVGNPYTAFLNQPRVVKCLRWSKRFACTSATSRKDVGRRSPPAALGEQPMARCWEIHTSEKQDIIWPMIVRLGANKFLAELNADSSRVAITVPRQATRTKETSVEGTHQLLHSACPKLTP